MENSKFSSFNPFSLLSEPDSPDSDLNDLEKSSSSESLCSTIDTSTPIFYTPPESPESEQKCDQQICSDLDDGHSSGHSSGHQLLSPNHIMENAIFSDNRTSSKRVRKYNRSPPIILNNGNTTTLLQYLAKTSKHDVVSYVSFGDGTIYGFGFGRWTKEQLIRSKILFKSVSYLPIIEETSDPSGYRKKYIFEQRGKTRTWNIEFSYWNLHNYQIVANSDLTIFFDYIQWRNFFG